MSFDPLKKAQESKTFCVMPWIQQYVGTAGEVKPCCLYEHSQKIGNLKENNLQEIWNNSATKEMRLKFLNGETDVNCDRYCNSRVEIGADSRSEFNNRFFCSDEKIQSIVASTKDDGSVEEHRLYYMDVRFNNLCNFSCRTCTPHFSTSWVLDDRKLYGRSIKNTINDGFQFAGKTETHALDEMKPHLADIKQVYFAGGEPLMQKEHYVVLENLLQQGNTNLQIRYSTNLSRLTLGNYDVIEYWKKFKNVRIAASIDGSHARAEYWRKGTIWKDIIKNTTRIRSEAPHVNFTISFTLSWPNAYNLVELHQEWVNLGYINVNDVFSFPLSDPSYYSLKHIPNWKKEKITELFNNQIIWLKSNSAREKNIKFYSSAIDYMWDKSVTDNQIESSLKEFNYYTNKLDQIRGENFWQVFPEHQDLKDYIVKNNLY